MKNEVTKMGANGHPIDIRSFMGRNGGPDKPLRPYIEIENGDCWLSPVNARRLIKHINHHLERIEKAKEEPQTKAEEL